MKTIIALTIILALNANAGTLKIIQHGLIINLKDCTIESIFVSDDTFINEYVIDCKDKILKVPSLVINDYNYMSKLTYKNWSTFCPVKKALITSNDFKIVFDCREWF